VEVDRLEKYVGLSVVSKDLKHLPRGGSENTSLNCLGKDLKQLPGQRGQLSEVSVELFL